MSLLGDFACLLMALGMVAGTAYSSYGLARALVGDVPVMVVWAATIVVGAWMATVGFHVLFALSLFNLIS